MRHVMSLVLVVAFVFAQAASRAQAQTSSEDVHVAPRAKKDPQKSKNGSDSSLKNRAGKITVDVNVVLVPTTITDQLNVAIPGLSKNDFEVYENGKKQEILHFSAEDVPTSICVIYDVSGSMEDKNEKAKEAIIEFFKSANPADEFCLITVAEEPDVLVGFTNSIEEIQERLVTVIPKGRTPLLDGIYLAIRKMKDATNNRKAILIISDGGDNKSRYTDGEVKSIVKEADIVIYAVGLVDLQPRTLEEMYGPDLLREITEPTGGRAFLVNYIDDLTKATERISRELRNLYVLGYRPKNLAQDGKWRKIKVKIKPVPGLPPLTVHAKQGYYAPAD